MSTLTQASNEWSNRPADERFENLHALQQQARFWKDHSRARVIASRQLQLAPVADQPNELVAVGPNGQPAALTNWSFGQVARLAGAPAGYLRTLHPTIAADCVNYGLHTRDVEDVGVLLSQNGKTVLRAATGPNYGRVWNADIVDRLVERFGDGINGQFRVPGEFKRRVEITKENTTLFASDRDMFVFLADEDHRIELPNRRNGESGSLARGFFVWNSEVGDCTFGIATFLFDYVCCNRIVWGAQEYKEIKIRHTAGAPVRFVDEVAPALQRYADSSTTSIVKALTDARQARIDNVDAFLAKRFSKSQAAAIKAAHVQDEGRPIETLWDAATGVTAYARDIKWQGDRVALERQAGEIIDLAS